MAKIDLKTVGTFVGGVLFGTAGLKILGSDDAKKVYTNCTAAGMRAKDCVMKAVRRRHTHGTLRHDGRLSLFLLPHRS